MRHQVLTHKLSRPTDHRMAMLRNLVTDLIKYEKLNTTLARAKETSRMAEKIITLGKNDNLHSRRSVLKLISDKNVVAKLFKELGTRYSTRNGGYTRVYKLGSRVGDGAEMAYIELVK